MAATVTGAPARDALAWLIDDAIKWREPQQENCGDCTLAGGACWDHAGDQAIADAVSALLAEVERADTDDEALAAVRAFGPLVLAEIAKAAGARGRGCP